MLQNYDIRLNRAWAEVSGSVESIIKRAGASPLPAKFAAILTGKEIIEINPDGFHYTRLIAGYPHEKIIYGAVNLTPDLIQRLTDAGIQLHQLPPNFTNNATTVNEDISSSELSYVERFADSLWGKLGIDVRFSRHFIDRLNDQRNGEPISVDELIRLFLKEYERNPN